MLCDKLSFLWICLSVSDPRHPLGRGSSPYGYLWTLPSCSCPSSVDHLHLSRSNSRVYASFRSVPHFAQPRARRSLHRDCVGSFDTVSNCERLKLNRSQLASVGLAACTALDGMPEILQSDSPAQLTSTSVRYGLGQHDSDIPLAEAMQGGKVLYASIIIYNIASSLTKLSILTQYWRYILSNSHRSGLC